MNVTLVFQAWDRLGDHCIPARRAKPHGEAVEAEQPSTGTAQPILLLARLAFTTHHGLPL